MSYVSTTDYWTAERYPESLGVELIQALRQRDALERSSLPGMHLPGMTYTKFSPAKSSPAPSSAQSVDFRPHTRARFEVQLLGKSLHAIKDEIALVAPYRLESGGFLWSHYPNRLYSALVCHASGPAHYSKHGRSSVRLGDASDVEAAFPDWLQRSELIRVGDFHNHLGSDGRPSSTDMETWASRLRASGRPRYVGLIVTPSVEGSGPQLHGWLTRTDGPGRYVCEPARINYGYH